MNFGSSLEVAFLPESAHGLPGRLGLAPAPGRWWPGRDLHPEELLDRDLSRLCQHYRASVLVTLLEALEMEERGLDGLLPAVRRAGLESLWFPIPDMGAPVSLDAAERLVRQILDRLWQQRTVVIHCLGGLGRSGTVAACVLAARGRAPGEALELVRQARPGAVQTGEQEAFVAVFHRGWHGGG